MNWGQKMKIEISDEAKLATKDIFNYLSKISKDYANCVINKIYKKIYELQSMPYIGRYVPELNDKHYRERICKDYRIIYFISEKRNTVYIRYIFCAKQNSNLFFEVHKKELIKFLNQFFT